MTGGTTSRRTPTAPARSCSRSSSRASARCWSATPTGGASRSTRTTSIGSCRRGSTIRPEAPSCCFAGEIDVLQSPPADQLERIAATPGLKVQKAESNQTLYLGFDQASPELRSSNVKGRNPFADRRVRQAFYQGIDIGRIVEALHGLAVPAGMLIWPKGIGWSEELDRRLPYDPDEGQGACSPRPATLRASTSGSTARRIESRYAARSAPRCRRSASRSTSRSNRLKKSARRSRPAPTDFFYWGFIEPFNSIAWCCKDRYRSDAEFAGTGYADPEVDALIDQIEGQMVTYVRDAPDRAGLAQGAGRHRLYPALSSDQSLGAARRSRSANHRHVWRPRVPRRALYDTGGALAPRKADLLLEANGIGCRGDFKVNR